MTRNRDEKITKHEPTEEEQVHSLAMLRAFEALQKLGWREAWRAPRGGSPFLVIEAGSTGIHECVRYEDGTFWLYDGDVWPSRPILWKPLP